jgi:hypothetical protein
MTSNPRHTDPLTPEYWRRRYLKPKTPSAREFGRIVFWLFVIGSASIVAFWLAHGILRTLVPDDWAIDLAGAVAGLVLLAAASRSVKWPEDHRD